ncbi:LysR substrate-binding domain-containing protein [Paraburkholderia sp. GAS334]|uniref:LysR family transcriptional regulator n=1 Tax=Paraburkholderia sp. GAS334 TaxID=3035131 RepID=UPI003D1D9298
MDLSAVEAFVRVAESRSFTEAARVMGLTGSGISRAISRLEAQTGVILLNRTTRNVGLTAEGAMFYERCRDILAELKLAETELLDAASAPSGRLRITAPIGYARSVLVPMLPKFRQLHSNVVVEMSLSDAIVDLIDDGFDLAIRIGELIPPKLTSRRIGVARWVACASREYLEEHGYPATPDDLALHDCVAFQSADSRRHRDWQFWHGSRSWTVRIGDMAQQTIDHCDVIVDAALAGAGIVYMHDYVVEPHLRQGTLVRVLEDYSTPERSIHLLYPAMRALTPKVQAFIEYSMHEFGIVDVSGHRTALSRRTSNQLMSGTS